MKKIIAACLSILVGAFGYTIVDSSIESRVSSLESQVEMLKGEISKYHYLTTTTESVTSDINSTTEPTKPETTQSTTYPSAVEKMLWPTVNNSVIIAGYPSYSDGSPHFGIDICVYDSNGNNASLGAPIYAVQSGKVIAAYNDNNWNMGYGNYCMIDHGNGICTLYAHANKINVSEGDVVKSGELIGKIGASGNTSEYNLHFEVRVKKDDGSSERVNPLDYVSAP